MIKKKWIKIGALLTFILALLIIYKHNPYRIEYIGNYDKVWAHRVNDTLKLKKAVNYFNGIELDLVYVKKRNVLDVSHPPEALSGLSFKEYINSNVALQKTSFWLDIKNLSCENSVDVLRRVENVISQANLKRGKVLIESRKPNCLNIFSSVGYNTSYYLVEDDLKNIEEINKVLDDQPLLAVSSDYKNYKEISVLFPNRDKYLWMIDGFLSHKFKAHKIMKDPTVKTLLVGFK